MAIFKPGLPEREMDKKKGTKPRTGIVIFEMRKHPRFLLELPVEYYRIDSEVSRTGHTGNASLGGLMVYFPEPLEVGQHLRLKLFFSSGPVLNTIEMVVLVVWGDTQMGKDGDYRSGVKIIDISPEDMNKLENFLDRLTKIKAP